VVGVVRIQVQQSEDSVLSLCARRWLHEQLHNARTLEISQRVFKILIVLLFKRTHRAIEPAIAASEAENQSTASWQDEV
jgi:hypothetical protein